MTLEEYKNAEMIRNDIKKHESLIEHIAENIQKENQPVRLTVVMDKGLDLDFIIAKHYGTELMTAISKFFENRVSALEEQFADIANVKKAVVAEVLKNLNQQDAILFDSLKRQLFIDSDNILHTGNKALFLQICFNSDFSAEFNEYTYLIKGQDESSGLLFNYEAVEALTVNDAVHKICVFHATSDETRGIIYLEK